jgi:hypothetical protein
MTVAHRLMFIDAFLPEHEPLPSNCMTNESAPPHNLPRDDQEWVLAANQKAYRTRNLNVRW